MQIKIDHDIPAPNNGRPGKYPFAQMLVGDSFLLPPGTSANTTRTSAAHFSRRHAGTKFSIRKTPEGYRLWRTA